MAVERPWITIVGTGPGSPEYLTAAAQRAIEGADVLVGAARLLDTFCPLHVERIVLGSDLQATLSAIARSAPKPIVVLVSGDPGIRSFAHAVVARFGKDACRILPGISSVQVAFAREALDWSDARIVDAHGGIPELDPSAARALPKIAVLTGCRAAAPWLSALFSELQPTHRVVVYQDLTLSTERVVPFHADLAALPRTIVLFLRKELSS